MANFRTEWIMSQPTVLLSRMFLRTRVGHLWCRILFHDLLRMNCFENLHLGVGSLCSPRG